MAHLNESITKEEWYSDWNGDIIQASDDGVSMVFWLATAIEIKEEEEAYINSQPVRPTLAFGED